MKGKILITGGSGLLALNWANTHKQSYNVILGLNKRIIKTDFVATEILDLGMYDSLLKKIDELNPDIIIHTAGLTSVELCESDPQLAYDVNAKLAGNIAGISKKLNKKLVHISTDHLFTGEFANVDENETPAPLNVYGKSKLEAERLVLENNDQALIIRTNFFGWGPSYRHSFSDTILNTLREGKEITLFQDVFFTPILMQTLIQSVHALIEQSQYGIFNVVGDERISKHDFGIKLANEFGLNEGLIQPISFSEKKELTKRPLDLSLSNKKTCSILGKRLGNVDEQLKHLHSIEPNEEIRQIRKL